VLFTDRGLQLAFVQAAARKKVAPTPHKSFVRTVFGWAWPWKKTWVMPLEDPEDPVTKVGKPGKTATGAVGTTKAKAGAATAGATKKVSKSK
jgi:hypothetical protein